MMYEIGDKQKQLLSNAIIQKAIGNNSQSTKTPLADGKRSIMVKHRIPSEYDLDQIAERKRLEMQKKIEAAAVALDVITLTTQAKSLNLSHVDLSSKYSDEALEGKTSGQE